MKKTDATLRALKIIADNEITAPSQFGELMWPDNPNWDKPGKCGRGSGRGVGMRLASGAYLGKLKRRGLICVRFIRNRFAGDYTQTYYLSDSGKAYIAQAAKTK